MVSPGGASSSEMASGAAAPAAPAAQDQPRLGAQSPAVPPEGTPATVQGSLQHPPMTEAERLVNAARWMQSDGRDGGATGNYRSTGKTGWERFEREHGRCYQRGRPDHSAAVCNVPPALYQVSPEANPDEIRKVAAVLCAACGSTTHEHLSNCPMDGVPRPKLTADAVAQRNLQLFRPTNFTPPDPSPSYRTALDPPVEVETELGRHRYPRPPLRGIGRRRHCHLPLQLLWSSLNSRRPR